ncbi:MAG: ferritin-like domain-containing protein [Dehalococcoidales bacterium]|nr:ferritin-like domain-containing protein [Dehalococcoidales bacterium]
MDKKEMVKLLNEDIEGEHAAIIQYLTHAYAIGEGDLACEIEAIAREEMRHLDMLAETIVRLGGTPSIKRGTMRTGGKTPPEWMQNDVLAEKDAIALYKTHLKAIDDPETKQTLQRILSDEESHHGDFVHFVDKTKKEKLKDVRGKTSNKLTETLNWGIEHEYTVIIQYIFQSYLTKNHEAQKELQDQGINEMQHLGWLAEKMIDAKSSPRIEHTAVEKTGKSDKLADMLKADIKVEKRVTAAYDKAAKETTDPKAKKLLERIRDHEIYHTKIFNGILKEEKAKKR